MPFLYRGRFLQPEFTGKFVPAIVLRSWIGHGEFAQCMIGAASRRTGSAGSPVEEILSRGGSAGHATSHPTLDSSSGLAPGIKKMSRPPRSRSHAPDSR